MNKGELLFVVEIPPNFQANVLAQRKTEIQINVDATAVAQAGNGANYLKTAISNEVQNFLNARGISGGSPINLVVRADFNPNLKTAWFSAMTQVINQITLLTVILTGAALIREREQGTVEHLLVMPVVPAEIMLAKMLANGLVILVAAMLSLQFVVHLVDRRADRWLDFAVPARRGALCAGGGGARHPARHAVDDDGPIRPLGDAGSDRHAIAVGQQHADGEHAGLAAIRDAHDQPDAALRLVRPGRAVPRRRHHVGLAAAGRDAHHRLGLLCLRHEPVPPRHFRELSRHAQDDNRTPNDGKMKRKHYEKELRKLQVELCQLQDWVKAEGARVIVVFEGRDAAGKGGTIKAITERVSPRVFRVVALPAPSDREKTQMFLQRYVEHFPAAGEIVIFDRSWYNRAGVENVMGFVSEKEVKRFLTICPEIEKYITDAGIILIKFWLEVGQEEQEKAVPGAHQRSAAAVEAQSDGSGIVSPLVRLFASARRDAQGHRYRLCALAHRQIGRQEARAAQLHLANA